VKELALHLLDIAENGVAAGAKRIIISVTVNELKDRLFLSVEDNGKGMSPEMVSQVIDPFVTSRTTRKVGLGIPLLKAAAEACDGGLTIQSRIGQGTVVKVEFRLHHIDRMPLGDLTATCLNLLIGYPDIHWIFRVTYNKEHFEFDDAIIKKELETIPLSDPAVIGYLREALEDGFSDLKNI